MGMVSVRGKRAGRAFLGADRSDCSEVGFVLWEEQKHVLARSQKRARSRSVSCAACRFPVLLDGFC